MRRRGNGDVITAQIYPYGEALGVDIGKMSQYICFLPMGNIKQDKLISGFFHFRIYRPGNDIPGCQPCTPGYRCQGRSEEHTSELQSRENLVCRLLLEKKKKKWMDWCPLTIIDDRSPLSDVSVW